MTAYLQKDREGLVKILSPNFQWHLHTGQNPPNGQTKTGIDGMLEELTRRANQWSEVSYSNIQIYCTESLITQTFHINGQDAINGIFDANGVDIYKIEDGKLLSKDSYWKHIISSNN